MQVSASYRSEADKKPFSIKIVLARIEKSIETLPKAALFELAQLGHASVFEQIVACQISIRTRDEVILPVAHELFRIANTPKKILGLGKAKLLRILRPCTFPGQKAQRIREIAQIILDKRGNEAPCDEAEILALPGIGPKCANLVLGIACGAMKISVDIHVHRITNRWGYVQAATPEKTMRELEGRLPAEYWTKLNSLLVPFGKHVCRGRLPLCSQCPVLKYCRQVGVKKHL